MSFFCRTQRSSSADLEFAIRHLVEVAVRALSPRINDPKTAIGVLDRLGAALCDIVPLHLHPGVILREGLPRLILPAIDYDGLTDSMFHLIRQNARGSPAILIRMLEVLTAVASCERSVVQRLETLHRHADLISHDAERDVLTPADLNDVRASYRRCLEMGLQRESAAPFSRRSDASGIAVKQVLMGVATSQIQWSALTRPLSRVATTLPLI